MSDTDTRAEAILERQVFIRGASRPFGELTEQDVGARAHELREAVGWGPTMRVASVARAWRELSEAMRSGSADRVAALPAEQVIELAPRLWVVLPGGDA